MRTVRKVLAARIGRVEVALDDEGETPVRCKGGDVSARTGLGSFEDECSPTHDAIAMLALERCLHARHSLVRYALHQADVKLDLVPLDDLPTREVGVSRHLCYFSCNSMHKRAASAAQSDRFAACSAPVAHLRLLG